MDVKALWHDVKFSLRHLNDFSRCAIVSDAKFLSLWSTIAEPFLEPGASFLHGITFGGHPVSCAVALANLDVFESEDLVGRVRGYEAEFRSALESLADLPIVGEIRGMGYFYGIELVKDQGTKESFDDDESERLLRGVLEECCRFEFDRRGNLLDVDPRPDRSVCRGCDEPAAGLSTGLFLDDHASAQ